MQNPIVYMYFKSSLFIYYMHLKSTIFIKKYVF